MGGLSVPEIFQLLDERKGLKRKRPWTEEECFQLLEEDNEYDKRRRRQKEELSLEDDDGDSCWDSEEEYDCDSDDDDDNSRLSIDHRLPDDDAEQAKKDRKLILMAKHLLLKGIQDAEMFFFDLTMTSAGEEALRALDMFGLNLTTAILYLKP